MIKIYFLFFFVFITQSSYSQVYSLSGDTSIFTKDRSIYNSNIQTLFLGNQVNQLTYDPIKVVKELTKELKPFLSNLFKDFTEKELKEKSREKQFINKVYQDSISLLIANQKIDSLTFISRENNEDLIELKEKLLQATSANKTASKLIKNYNLIPVNTENDSISFEFDLNELQQDEKIVTVYKSENRNTSVIRYLNRFGFVNGAGYQIIDCKYEFASNFSDGLALVKLGGKYGFITTLDKPVIPFEYDFALPFKNKKAVIAINGKWYIINPSGRKIHKIKNLNGAIKNIQYLKYKDRMVIQYKDGRTFLADKNGKYIIYFSPSLRGYLFERTSFSEIHEIENTNLYKVKNFDGTFQLVNKSTRPLSEQYSYNFFFNKYNHAVVCLMTSTFNPLTKENENPVFRSNIINLEGKKMIADKYSRIEYSEYGVYLVMNENGSGIMDSSFTETVVCGFGSIYPINRNYFIVSDFYFNEKDQPNYGLINDHGLQLLIPAFDQIEIAQNKLQVSYSSTNSLIEITKEGKLPKVNCLSNCDEFYRFLRKLKQD